MPKKRESKKVHTSQMPDMCSMSFNLTIELKAEMLKYCYDNRISQGALIRDSVARTLGKPELSDIPRMPGQHQGEEMQ